MNWGTNYSGSNNIHFDFPPIMEDGRNYSNWQTGTKINDDLRKSSGIKSNWEYRKYLQDNADSIAKFNQLNSINQSSSYVPVHDIEEKNKHGTPYLYKSDLEKTKPIGYESSDLKSEYVTSIQLQSRMFTPVITQEQLIRYGYQKHN